MTLFEMKASHLFAVEHKVGKKIARYEVDMGNDEWDSTHDAAKTFLGSLEIMPKSKVSVIYDFGDHWEISLVLEKTYNIPISMIASLPRVLEGEGYGIVEDCGGRSGLVDLMKAFKAKSGDEYEEFCTWLGRRSFNFNKFSVSRANERLKIIPEIYEQIYEDDVTASEEECKYIDAGTI
jgi:hypothetical protein